MTPLTEHLLVCLAASGPPVLRYRKNMMHGSDCQTGGTKIVADL